MAVDPSDTDVVVAGSNDYCAAIVNGEVWAGLLPVRRTGERPGRTAWCPGIRTTLGRPARPRRSTERAARRATRPRRSTRDGNLFYGFICFNRSKPINGGVYVARYSDHGAHYDQTVLVKRGTPSGQFQAGLFQDKINLTADQTDGEHAGNVYVAWSQYHAFGPANAVLFARSTDGGDSFSKPFKVTPQEHGTASFADLAVGPDGTVYLTYLTYPSSSSADGRRLAPQVRPTAASRSATRSTSRRSSCSTRTSSPARPGRWTAATDRSPARAGSRSRGSSATRPWRPTRTASTSSGHRSCRAARTRSSSGTPPTAVRPGTTTRSPSTG